MQAAPVSDYPFKRAVFWCNVFPPEVYADLNTYWPPFGLMRQDLKSGRSKQVSHKHASERYKTSLQQLVNYDAAKAKR